MTSKGQLTIPKAVRDSLRLHAGDRVEFVLLEGSEATMKPLRKSVDEVFGTLHRPGQAAKSVEDMKAAVAERMRKRVR
jgi:AbrB family looped-hinge helix DNA binding protein